MRTNKRTIKRTRKSEVRIVTREEESQIVALLRSTETNQKRIYLKDVADLVEVLVDTGLRQMEALNLLYQDIDFAANVIFVRQTKSKPRRVPMTNRATTILKRRQKENQDKPFNLSEMQIRIAWRRVKAEITILDPERLMLYSLRRTCVQRLIDAGVNKEVVSEWIGLPVMLHERNKEPLPLSDLIEAAKMLEQYNLSHHQ